MGKHRATGPARRAAGSVVAAGAVPLIATLIGAGTANAEALPAPPASPPIPALPANPLQPASATPDPVRDLTTVVHDATQVAVRSATDTFGMVAAPLLPAPPAPAPAAVAEPVPTPATRQLPTHAYLAPQGELHAPMPVAPVAPIEAPPGKLRIGNVVMDAPPFDVREINTGAAQAEAQVATFYDSVGVERSRSDRMAAQTVGSAAIGASVANTLASPIATTSAMVGAVAGLISGVPFLPIGLVVGPVLGAAIGYAVIAAPAMAVGAAVGGAVGAAEGYTAAPFGAAP
ncbi:DUF456 domain-containing protein [Nocardia speluncae]|uniref:DUF456 domain-containing protein n=1 Tax=Nocardia speluncae TaxID=419477 RepID=A0A846X7N5_9NOCA|nr:hypothetical protein [Nocardia speluncae]NKY32211.1 DUF456 domain-containing protein [Nocardia speluncae]